MELCALGRKIIRTGDIGVMLAGLDALRELLRFQHESSQYKRSWRRWLPKPPMFARKS